MKKLDAELVMMNPDATEAERLDCGKFFRQQLRSHLTVMKRAAMMLGTFSSYPGLGTEARAMHQEAEVDLENTIVYIGWLREQFPALADDWDDCERRANALHQELCTSDNKIRATQ
jgi:hypothetical protein